MVSRIYLDVTKDEKGFLIDGKREYLFESGVEYNLVSKEPLWATWSVDDFWTKIENGRTDVVEVYNLTCPDHHRYNNDSQLYYIWMSQIGLAGATPIGLINKEVPDTIPEDISGVVGEGEGWNGIIEERKKFLTNNTFEELFNLEQDKYITPTVHEYINTQSVTTPYQFVNSERYIGIALDGVRVSPKTYSAEFLPGSYSNKIFFKNYIQGEIVTKTGLCHNVYDNGSEHIKVLFRKGDERRFYISNLKGDLPEPLVIKGAPSAKNKIEIRSQFDAFVLEQYPQLFEFLQSYYDLEGFSGTAQSYLRNMIDYVDVDKMPEEELEKKIRRVFTPTTDDGSDPRILIKHLIDFYKNKGNLPSYKWLSNVLFKKDTDIERFSDKVIKLSDAPWHALTRITISDEDVKAMMGDDVNRVLGSTPKTTSEEMVNMLVGYAIAGRTSQAEAVVEYVEKQIFQRQIFYHVYVTVQFGEFLQSEPIDIKRISTQITINSISYKSEELGIIGFDIKNSGNGYIPGQEVQIQSTTGDGFLAFISRVGDNGEAKEILIRNPGWFFRPRENPKAFVPNDYGTFRKPLNPSAIYSEMRLISDSYAGYVRINDKIEPIVLNPTGGVIIANRWEINRNNSLYNSIFAYAVVEGKQYFFGLGLNGTYIEAVDTTDNRVRVSWAPEEDEVIVRVVSNDRTIFAVGQQNIYAFEIGSILKPDPVYTKFPYNAVETGLITAIFSTGSGLFGFTDQNTLVELDTKGNVVNSYPFGMSVDYVSYTRKGSLYNLYIGNGGNLYFYQWFDGNPRLEAIPIFGRIDRDRKLRNGLKYTLSSYSVFNDNDVNQDFSVGIVLDEFTNNYMKTYKETINTSGFKYYGVVKRTLNNLSTGKTILYSDIDEGE